MLFFAFLITKVWFSSIKGSDIHVSSKVIDISKCDGSKEAPFPDVFYAMKNILFGMTLANLTLPEKHNLIILDEIISLDKSADSSFIAGESILEQAANTILNLSIFPDHNLEFSILCFTGPFPLALSFSKGSLSLRNIKFLGDQAYGSSKSKNAYGAFSPGFITIRDQDGYSLNITNCEIKWGFSKEAQNGPNIKTVSSFVYLDAIGIIEVNLINFKVENSFFRRGLLYTEVRASEKVDFVGNHYKIIARNITVENYNSDSFTHWGGGVSHYKSESLYIYSEILDFLFVLRKTEGYFENFQIFNSSRLLYSNDSLKIEARNFNFNGPAGEGWVPPELFLFDRGNKAIQIDNLTISDCIFYSFDDTVNRIRDLPLFTMSFQVTFRSDFERSQALLHFGSNNQNVILTNFNIRNLTLFKKDNLFFSLFAFDYNNVAIISGINTITFLTDSSSQFGGLFFLFCSLGNKLSIVNSTVDDIRAYTFSLIYVFFSLVTNDLTLRNSSFTNIYLKNKSIKEQLDNFTNYMNANFEALLFTETIYLELSGLCIGYFNNSITFQEINVKDIYCLTSCVVQIAFMGKFFIKLANFQKMIGESLSSTIFLGHSNEMIIEGLTLNRSRSLSGSIVIRRNSRALIKSSLFIESWASTAFVFDEFYQYLVAGGIFIGRLSNVTILNSEFRKGKSDICGGSLSIYLDSSLTINNSIFKENESPNMFSQGGVLKIFTNSKIFIFNCSFINNFGNLGGIFHVERNNSIFLSNSSFSNNKAEEAAFAHMQIDNIFNISHSQFYSNIGTVKMSLLSTLYSGQKIWIFDCWFEGNQANLNSALFSLTFQNSFFMVQSSIYYNNEGAGDLIWLDEMNNIVVDSCIIRETANMNVLIRLQEKNTITIISTMLSKLTSYMIIAFYNNIINIAESSAYESQIDIQMKGLMIFHERNTIYISDSKFYKISGAFGVIYQAKVDNYLYMQQIKVWNINITSAGGSMLLEIRNHLEINNCYFSDLLGDGNSTLLLQVGAANFILVHSTEISGSFREIWNLGVNYGIISFEGEINMMNIYNCIVKVLGINTFYLYIVLINTSKNEVLINKTLIEVKNLSGGLFIYQSNRLIIENTRLRSDLLGNLILLSDKSSLTLLDCIMPENFGGSYYTISAGISCTLNITNTVVKNNYYFISLKKSIAIMKNLKFRICTDKINSYDTKDSILILATEDSVVLIEKIELICSLSLTSSIILVDHSNLNFRDSLIAFNQGIKGGALNIINYSLCNIKSLIFLSNTGLLGGAIHFENVKELKMVDNKFILNRALIQDLSLPYQAKLPIGMGGTFYFSFSGKGRNSIDVFARVKNNLLKHSTADIGGVVYFWPEWLHSDLLFAQNQIKAPKINRYGHYQASPTVLITVWRHRSAIDNSTGTDRIAISEEISQSKTYQGCIFQVLSFDINGQLSAGDLVLKVPDDPFSSPFKFDFELVRFCPCLKKITVDTSKTFKNLVNKGIVVSFNYSQFIDQTQALPAIFKKYNNRSFKIEFKLEKCHIGEYYDGTYCKSCPPDFYSFNSEFADLSSCTLCNGVAFYCYGGFNLTPKSGFWRLSDQSIKFLKCPNRIACLGDPLIDSDLANLTAESYNVKNPKGVCALGYSGALCSSCESGYSKTDGKRCLGCFSLESVVIMVIKTIVRAVVFFFMIFQALMLSKSLSEGKVKPNLVKTNFLIKILLSHFQIVRLLLAFPFEIPSTLTGILNIMSITIVSGADRVLNLDCFSKIGRDFPINYLYNIITVGFPIFVVIFLKYLKLNFCERKIRHFCKYRMKNSSRRRSSLGVFDLLHKQSSFLSVLVIVLMLSFDQIFICLIENFSFINLNDERPESKEDLRLISNFEIVYDSESHRFWMVVFAIPSFILCVLFPTCFILIRIIYKKRKNLLEEPSTLYRYGYFYYAYKRKFYLYEFFYIFRKALLMAIEVFVVRKFSLSTEFHPSTFLILLWLLYFSAAVYAWKHKPYENTTYDMLNFFDTFGFLVQGLTLWIASMWLSLDMGSENIGSAFKNVIRYFLLAVLIILNSLFLILWIRAYWKVRGQKTISKIINFLGSITLFLKKQSRLPSEVLRPSNQITKIELGNINSDFQKQPFNKANYRGDHLLTEDKTTEFLANELRKMKLILKLFQKENNFLRKRLSFYEDSPPNRRDSFTHVPPYKGPLNSFDLPKEFTGTVGRGLRIGTNRENVQSIEKEECSSAWMSNPISVLQTKKRLIGLRLKTYYLKISVTLKIQREDPSQKIYFVDKKNNKAVEGMCVELQRKAQLTEDGNLFLYVFVRLTKEPPDLIPLELLVRNAGVAIVPIFFSDFILANPKNDFQNPWVLFKQEDFLSDEINLEGLGFYHDNQLLNKSDKISDSVFHLKGVIAPIIDAIIDIKLFQKQSKTDMKYCDYDVNVTFYHVGTVPLERREEFVKNLIKCFNENIYCEKGKE